MDIFSAYRKKTCARRSEDIDFSSVYENITKHEIDKAYMFVHKCSFFSTFKSLLFVFQKGVTLLEYVDFETVTGYQFVGVHDAWKR